MLHSAMMLPNPLRVLSVLALLCPSSIASTLAQQPQLGLFEGQADIGTVEIPGSATYDPEEQAYVVAGSGANMWGEHDEFHLVWKRMRGDFILRTRAEFLGEGVDPHRKMGWIIRSGLDPSAA